MKFHSQHYFVGEQADRTPVPEQFEAGPFRKSRPPEPLRFEVNMVAEAHGKQQKTGTVQVNIPGFSHGPEHKTSPETFVNQRTAVPKVRL